MVTYKQVEYIATLAIFLLGFFLFYSQTAELLSSLVAAVLSAALVWISFIMIGWLSQVFTK
jgi:hypothetical protein